MAERRAGEMIKEMGIKPGRPKDNSTTLVPLDINPRQVDQLR